MQRRLLLLVCLCWVHVDSLPTVRTDHTGKERVQIYSEALPDELVELLTKDCHALADYEAKFPALKNGKYRTRWFPRNEEPKTAIEEAIVRLRKLVKLGDKNVGSEWWVQRISAGQDGQLGFHVDKDESIASNQHYLFHPEYASILYLTNKGGGTLIVNQYSPEGNGYLPDLPREGHLVLPAKNKYAIFNGDLLHGVIPGASDARAGEKRITFLVNFWDVKPLAPNCEELKYKEVPGLKLYRRSELTELRRRLDGDASSSSSLAQRETIPKVYLTSKRQDVEAYEYTIDLPGKGHEMVRLPRAPASGSHVELIWKSKKRKKKPQQQDAVKPSQSTFAESADSNQRTRRKERLKREL